MSFLYPNVIAVHRPAAQTGEGALGYGGATQASETVVASGIPASIQLRREGQRNPTGAPGDGSRPTYDVMIPLGALAKGVVQNLDLILDEMGNRYQVVGPYWQSLGYNLRVELLAP